MSTAGPNYATVIAATGSADWVNIANMGALDAALAVFPDAGTWSPTGNTDIVRMQGFGFDLPADAVIVSITGTATARLASGTGPLTWLAVRLYDPVGESWTSGSDISAGTSLTSVSTGVSQTVTLLDPDDLLWGLTGVDADFVNDADFGIQWRLRNGGPDAASVEVDAVSLEIAYTSASESGAPAGAIATPPPLIASRYAARRRGR